MDINFTYSMYEDSNEKDPDSYSKTLNQYHTYLWNKKLPNENLLNASSLFKSGYKVILNSKDYELSTSSDAIIHTFSNMKQMQAIIQELPKSDIYNFFNIGSTIGGYIIFPSQKIDNQQTINVRRGFHPAIKDRFDLTLECIRRWYKGQPSPLNDVFNRYHSFFELFTDFKGYIDFFLLNDLVDDKESIKFWLPFKNFFETPPLPRNTEEYQLYMKNAIAFVNDRNNRINNWNMINKIQINFHQLITEKADDFTDIGYLLNERELLPTIDISDLNIKKWFPIVGMYGGFSYQLRNKDSEFILIVEYWSRVIGGSERRCIITDKSTVCNTFE